MFIRKLFLSVTIAIFAVTLVSSAYSQDMLPADDGIATYHTSPRYRESESHPLRLLAYIVHPVGWVLREAIFRPISYFASSTETRRSVMGFREPYDYRQPECFSADDSAPDCRALKPFNYDMNPEATEGKIVEGKAQVYFPDVNFDFDKSSLSDLGRGQVHRIAKFLKENTGDVKVVLEGNADARGSDAYNEKLGMDRAEAVRRELVGLGIPAERLATVTFGKSKPILDEQEDWARAVNRRVEVHTDNVVVPAEQ